MEAESSTLEVLFSEFSFYCLFLFFCIFYTSQYLTFFLLKLNFSFSHRRLAAVNFLKPELRAKRLAANAAKAANRMAAKAAKAANAANAVKAKVAAKVAKAAKAEAKKNGDYELTERMLSSFSEEQLRAFRSLNPEAQRILKKSGGGNLSHWRHRFNNKQIGGSGGGGGGGGGGTKRPSSGKGSGEQGKKRKKKKENVKQ